VRVVTVASSWEILSVIRCRASSGKVGRGDKNLKVGVENGVGVVGDDGVSIRRNIVKSGKAVFYTYLFMFFSRFLKQALFAAVGG
jgi:hypothetical protein